MPSKNPDGDEEYVHLIQMTSTVEGMWREIAAKKMIKEHRTVGISEVIQECIIGHHGTLIHKYESENPLLRKRRD